MPFKCDYCPKFFSMQLLLHRHVKIFHPEAPSRILPTHQSNVHSFRQSRQYVIKWHNQFIGNKLKQDPYMCKDCNFTCQSADALRKHKLNCAIKSELLDRTEARRKKLDDDQSNVNKEKRFKNQYKCEYCSKHFLSDKTLQTHVQKYHADERKVKRRMALLNRKSGGKSTEKISEVKREILDYWCDECSRHFGTEKGLRCHKRICHCTEDGEISSGYKNKKIIVKTKQPRKHSANSSSYICEKCGICFSRAILLHAHKRVCCLEADVMVITSQMRPLIPKTPISKEDGAPSLELSESAVTTFGTKDLNQESDGEFNTDESFQCDFCKQYFRTKTQLRNHIRTYHLSSDVDRGRKRAETKHLDCVLAVAQCSQCNLNFSSHKKYTEHMQLSHPGGVASGPALIRPPLLQWAEPVKSNAGVECPYCKRTCIKNSSLRRHVKKLHPGAELPKCRTRGRKVTTKNSEPPPVINCSECESVFYSKRGLRLHMKKVHNAPDGKSRFIFSLANTLDADNLMGSNGLPSYKELTFDSMADFLRWKADEENNSVARFNKVRRDQKNRDGSIRRTYVCHRSGTYTPHGHGVRRIKLQGSAKIGTRCPATIYIKCYPNGKTMVKYFPQHAGHDCDPVHLLKKQDRKKFGLIVAPGGDVVKRPRNMVKKSKELATEHVIAIQSALEDCSPDVMKSICAHLSQIRAMMSTSIPTTLPTVVSVAAGPIAQLPALAAAAFSVANDTTPMLQHQLSAGKLQQTAWNTDTLQQIQFLPSDFDNRHNVQQFFIPNVPEEVLSFMSL